MALGVVGVMMAALASPVLGATAFSITGTTINNEGVTFVMGYNFTPNTTIAVTHLGVYVPDYLGTPPAQALIDQEVGIFLTATQTLVAPSVVVTQTDTPVIGTTGNPGFHDGYFRYHQLPSEIVLDAGTSYAVIQTVRTYMYNHSGGQFQGLSVSPDITFGNTGRWQVSVGGNLFYPAGTEGSGNYDSLPNFIYLVPEPASAALMGAGVMLCLSRRIRREA